MTKYDRKRKALKGEYMNDKSKTLEKKKTGRTKLPKSVIQKELTSIQ